MDRLIELLTVIVYGMLLAFLIATLVLIFAY